MTRRIASASGLTIRGAEVADQPLTITAIPRDRVVSGEESEVNVIDDAYFVHLTAATIDHEAAISVSGAYGYRLVNVAPDVASLDSEGRLTRLMDGTAKVDAVGAHFRRRVCFEVTRDIGQETVGEWVDHVAGSLAAACTTEVQSRTADADSSNLRIHDGAQYLPACWADDIDLTGVSREIPRCTLIAPDCVLMAEHYPASGEITFLARDGAIHATTIGAGQDIGDEDIFFLDSDVRVAKVDPPLPAAIKPLSVAPADMGGRLPTIGRKTVPVLAFDQDENALVKLLSSLDEAIQVGFVYEDGEPGPLDQAWVSGDSGSPAALVVDGSPILIALATYGGSGSGTRIHAYLDEINAAMTAVGSAHQLDVADLSAWPDYS